MATTDNENILMMFEEINQKLDKTHLQIEKKLGNNHQTKLLKLTTMN